MIPFPHLAQRLYNAPLMISPEKAEVLEALFRARVSGADSVPTDAAIRAAEEARARHELAAGGFRRSDAGYLVSDRGVALIPILGSLMQRAGGMDAMSGMEGYNRIASRIDAAVADPNVRGILLEIDSPGGEANGAFDLAARIAAAGQKKPLWAIANEQAFSAAYLLASAATELYVPASGMVGSVGVIMMHVDQSAADAKKGYVYTPIYAGERKADFSSHAPLTEKARALAQAEVDRVYELFVDAVSSGRRIDAQTVRDTEAGLLDPKAALELGMIDGVSSFGDTLSAFEAAAMQPRRMFSLQSAAAAASTDERMDNMAEVTKPAATQAAATFTQAELEQAEARGRAEGEGAAKAAADAARTRISTILGSEEAKGREELAKHFAFESDISAEAAIAALKAAPKAAAAPANPLADAMRRVPNPSVGTTAGGDSAPRKVVSASEVFARRRQQAGHA